MLSSVSSAVAQLTQLPAAPEDLARAEGAQPRAARTLARTRPGPATAAASPATPRAKAAPKRLTAGYAQAASSSAGAKSTSTAKKKAGPLDFLDDPKLPVEEKLLRLLAYLNDKWNKDLDKKMKELKQEGTAGSGASGGTKTTSKASGGGVSGFLKKAVGVAGKAIPQLGVTLEALGNPAVRGVVSKLAGPALAAFATAMGQPELAPIALKYGPEIVDTLAGAASSLSGGAEGPRTLVSGARTSGTSSSAATKDTATDLGSDRNAQLKLMELQRILDQQKEMFSLVSNLLRTTHETRMALIQNVR